MTRPNLRRGRSPASYYVTASLLWPAGIIAVTASLAAGDLRAALSGGARWRLTWHRRLDAPGCYEIYDSKEAAMMTHTTVQALGQAPAGRPARPSPARCAGPRRSPGCRPRPAAAVPDSAPGPANPLATTSIGRPRKAIRDG